MYDPPPGLFFAPKSCPTDKVIRPDGDAALLNVAKGNIEVWRQNRNAHSGFYKDSINIIDPDEVPARGSLDALRTVESLTPGLRTAVEAGNALASTGITGLGLIMEAIAHALGWQSASDTISRVSLTLRSLVGKTPGISPARDPRGFYVHYMDLTTGAAPRATTSCLMCTGLLMAGVLFCSTYLKRIDPKSSAEVSALADELWGSIDFPSILCSNGVLSPAGTGIPMTLNLTGTNCGPAKEPEEDGYYQFNEEHYTIWFAFQQACGKQPPGHCSNAAIQTMWEKWQGRRLHPNHAYEQYSLLSTWSGYVVQLPYYTSHSFNADAAYQGLFRNHWLADWAYYNNTQHAGERGRYGLGAGPVPAECSEGERYLADRLDEHTKSHCRIYSPYVLAGYLPVAPEQIRAQLLQLLEDGDAVVPVPKTDTVVLWRRSMLEPGWPSSSDNVGARFTLVDFSSELLGVASLFLPAGFFANNTKHFQHDGSHFPAPGQQPPVEGRVPRPAGDALGDAVDASALLRFAAYVALAGGVSVGSVVLVQRWRVRHKYQEL